MLSTAMMKMPKVAARARINAPELVSGMAPAMVPVTNRASPMTVTRRMARVTFLDFLNSYFNNLLMISSNLS